MRERSSTFHALGLNHLALRVTDLDRSQAFYERHLGMTRIPSPAASPRAMACGPHVLNLFQAAAPQMDQVRFTVPDYDPKAAAERLRAQSIVPDVEDDRVHFLDPDGYKLQVGGPNAGGQRRRRPRPLEIESRVIALDDFSGTIKPLGRSAMKGAMLVAILVAVAGLSAGVVALNSQQQKPLKLRDIQKMRDNLYFISGGELNERETWTGATRWCSRRQGRRAGRHDAPRRRARHPRPDQVGHRQAGDDDHQYAHPFRPYRQQHGVSRHGRIRCARGYLRESGSRRSASR